MSKVDLRDPRIVNNTWQAGQVRVALEFAGLTPPDLSDYAFPVHWSEGATGGGYYVGVTDGRVWLREEHDGDQMWFDSIEEADAWVFACWRMCGQSST